MKRIQTSLFVVACSLVIVGCGGGGSGSGKKLPTSWTALSIQRPGATTTSMINVNASGMTVGTSDGRLVTWNELDGFTVYGTLGGATSEGMSINDSGATVGNADNGTTERGVYATGGTLVELSLGLPASSGSNASAINTAGAIAGVTWDAGNVYNIFKLEGGVVTNFGNLSGTGAITVTAISDNGQITGVAPGADGKSHVFRSSGSGLVDLGSGPGNFAEGNGINKAGTVVGVYLLNGKQIAFKSVGTNLVALPLPSGATESIAFGINDSNDIVGCVTISGVNYAYLWRGNGGFDLNTVLRNALPGGATLSVARGITADGTIVSTMRVGAQDQSALLSP